MFWKTMQSAARRGTPDLPDAPPFDERKIRAQLDDVRGKLAATDISWLDRLALQGQERGLVFALEHKTVAATVAYSDLMSLRCQAALYKKCGGKVVAMQISIEPIGAYIKLVQEAETSGKLEFHDAALKQAFWKRMNDYLAHREVPPEHVDFSLPVWLQLGVQLPAAAPSTPSGGSAVLDRFVGVWNTSVTMNPAKWSPEGGTFNGQESTQRVLEGRYILGREIRQPDGVKALWIMTYDPERNAYPFWLFNTAGLFGGQWINTWDTATNTLTGEATYRPSGWTSCGTNQFPEPNTILVTAWIKDETGALLLDSNSKRTRQPADSEKAIVAAWAKTDPATSQPVIELKILERLIGTWDSTNVSKPAVWTPKEVHTTATVTRKWVLNGLFVLDTARHSDGKESLSLTTFDPQTHAYRKWWFHSDGNYDQAQGSWDEAAEIIRWQSDAGSDLTTTAETRFMDGDHIQWSTVVKNRSGKVYFHMEGTSTRAE